MLMSKESSLFEEIKVRGVTCTTVQYLVQFFETKEFMENKIETSCLDVTIEEKSVGVPMLPCLIVVSGAVLIAFQHQHLAVSIHSTLMFLNLI